MKKPTEYEAMFNCAVLHYEDGLDQIETAKKLGVSQSQVSRLLRKAREEGILEVHVTIQHPSFRDLDK